MKPVKYGASPGATLGHSTTPGVDNCAEFYLASEVDPSLDALERVRESCLRVVKSAKDSLRHHGKLSPQESAMWSLASALLVEMGPTDEPEVSKS